MGKLLRLISHPDHPPLAVRSVEVEVWTNEDPDMTGIDFYIEGHERLVIPPRGEPERADELWRTTCLEFFVRPLEGERYWEFNLSPSRRWAAYSFERWRSGRQDLPLFPSQAPTTGQVVHEGRLWFDTEFTFFGLPTGRDRKAGISCILEEEGGHMSYWALAHPPGRPDFHHRDCFVLDLPPAD